MKGKQNKRQCRGFSMIELMAVIIIMGLLFAVVANNFMGKVDQAKVITTKANLKLLHDAVKSFKMDTGRYPTEEEGLDVLINAPMDVQNYQEGGYIEETALPVDGWKSEFEYERYPENGKPFLIRSYGSDSQEGGEGDGVDLLSTDA
jgi:general secretion pathway protein G